MRKALILLLVLLLAGCSLPAASNPDATALPPDPPPGVAPAENAPPAPERDDLTTVRWLIIYPMRMDNDYMQSNIAKPAEAMADVLNPSLANAGLKLEITMGGFRDAAEYADKVPTIIASKEDYDLMTLFSEYTPLHSWIVQGYFKDFEAEIDAHQPILDALDPIQVKLARSGQKMHYIPSAFHYSTNNGMSHLIMEEDVATSLNLDPPTSFGDLLSAVRAAHDAALPYQVALDHTTFNEFRREDPAFPCVISNDLLFVYDAEGCVASYAHSDVFQRDAERISALRAAAPDALSIFSQEDIDSTVQGTRKVGPNIFIFSPNHPAAWQNRQGGGMRLLQLSPDQPQVFFSSPYGTFVSVVPAYADGFSALRFLDWAYGSADNYMLFRYGAEGVNYTKNSDGSMSFSEENPSGDLSWYAGQNTLNESVDQSSDHSSVWFQLEDRNGYELMPWDGFVFDPTPVQNLYERVNGLYIYGDYVHSYGNSMMSGSGSATKDGLYAVIAYMRGEIPMDDFDQKLAQLDEAGLPEVLAECRKQYADYLAATGWKP